MTQAPHHPPGHELIARGEESGKNGKETLRILERNLSDSVYHAPATDARPEIIAQTAPARQREQATVPHPGSRLTSGNDP